MKKKPPPQEKSARRPTISDVARAAGVAQSTVSHALNNKGYVDAKTRERILDAVDRLGYRPNARARSLRTGGVKTIALVSTMPLGVAGGASKLGFLMELAAVAAEEAVKRGLALILIPPQPERSELPALEVDGSIMVEPAEDDKHLEWLRRTGYPLVCLGRWFGHDEVPHVDLLSEQTTNVALAHLKEVGAKRIAVMIGTSRRTSYIETEAAYRAFCKKERAAPVVVKLDEQGGELAGHIAATDLFQRHPEVDAVYAQVDAFASGVIQAAAAWGKAVPRDFKVVTRYDGLRAKLAIPPITAVDLHLDEVAAMGVELLSQILAGGDAPVMLRPRMPEIVARASTRG